MGLARLGLDRGETPDSEGLDIVAVFQATPGSRVSTHDRRMLEESFSRMASSHVVKWKETTSGNAYSWFLRGVRDDGRYYGEVVDRSDKQVRRIEGQLSAVDTAQVNEIFERISRACEADLTQENGWLGLVAEGRPGQAVVRFRYYDGDEAHSPLARLFLDLISLLRRYVMPG